MNLEKYGSKSCKARIYRSS